MAADDKTVKESIKVLLNYEQGKINLKDATNQLKSISGLSEDVAETFIRSLERNNVIPIKEKQ
tara:strand:+ start:313 stop:501 length:189 start_codon:yes stop_codon:yes gene_type:complete